MIFVSFIKINKKLINLTSIEIKEKIYQGDIYDMLLQFPKNSSSSPTLYKAHTSTDRFLRCETKCRARERH